MGDITFSQFNSNTLKENFVSSQEEEIPLIKSDCIEGNIHALEVPNEDKCKEYNAKGRRSESQFSAVISVEHTCDENWKYIVIGVSCGVAIIVIVLTVTLIKYARYKKRQKLKEKGSIESGNW